MAFFSAGFGVSFGCWEETTEGEGEGVWACCFCSSFAGAGFEAAGAAAGIADLSSLYSIKSAPTSSLLDSWTNNFVITPAPSDLISTYFY